MPKLAAFHQRGDTIIEVLLAVAVFSLVAVGAIVVMNQGTNSSLRALEVTLVKQQVDSQAEALRAAQQDYFVSKSNGSTPASGSPGAAWTQARAAGSQNVATSTTTCPTKFANAFAMNGRTAAYISVAGLKDTSAGNIPYAQIKYDTSGVPTSYGIWITRQPVTGSFNPKAFDFTIHACWYGPGTQVPVQVQTIVRLYDAP